MISYRGYNANRDKRLYWIPRVRDVDLDSTRSERRNRESNETVDEKERDTFEKVENMLRSKPPCLSLFFIYIIF